MWWKGRVYFLSDRDGTMNLWSMDENGKNLKQHTKHQGCDLKTPSLSHGRIVYQIGADLRLYEIAIRQGPGDPDLPGQRLRSAARTLDQEPARLHNLRASIAGRQKRGADVARTRLRGASEGPVGRCVGAQARTIPQCLVPAGRKEPAGCFRRKAERWSFGRLPANGTGAGERLTTDGTVLRWEGVPSPDGKWIAHQDKDNQLWLLDTATKAQKRITYHGGLFDSGPQYESCAGRPTAGGSPSRRSGEHAVADFLYNVETGAIRRSQRTGTTAMGLLDSRWQVALFRLRSRVEIERGCAMGLAPAGAAFRPRRQDLSAGAAKETAVALRTARRAAPR